MDLTFTLALAIGGAVLVTAMIALGEYHERKRKREERAPTLQDKIADLTKNLKSSIAVITEIETEILKRKGLVQNLEADIERFSKLKELSLAQVESIAQALTIPLEKQSRKSLIMNAIINFAIALGFFVFGYFIGGR